MYFTNVTTKATAVAIVAMAASHFALAAPVALFQADILRNGQDPKELHKRHKQVDPVTVQDPCNGMSAPAPVTATPEKFSDTLWDLRCSWRKGLYRWQLRGLLPGERLGGLPLPYKPPVLRIHPGD